MLKINFIICFLLITNFAEASSISTRVRELEEKVNFQNKKINEIKAKQEYIEKEILILKLKKESIEFKEIEKTVNSVVKKRKKEVFLVKSEKKDKKNENSLDLSFYERYNYP